MKKIINGKKYDTETANCIGDYQYSNKFDFHYFYEVLYQKKTKEFFLHATGGAMSKWCNEMGGYGEYIVPYSESEAKEWIETHCGADVYENLFGEVDE